MKKIINLCLLITSLFGYLEWGKGYHAFLFQAEAEIFLKGINNTESFIHPLVLVPLLGQLILVFTLFQPVASKRLSLIGLACLSLIMLMILLVGILSLNLKIGLSAVPFIATGVWMVRYNRHH